MYTIGAVKLVAEVKKIMIQFKNRELEAQLEAKAASMIEKSPSLVAATDLERYSWLIANEPPINLTLPEFYAFCSTVKAMPHLRSTSQIKRLPLLVEDAMRSVTMSDTGQYSAEHLWTGMKVDELSEKLHQASPLQLFALIDRSERVSEKDMTAALLSQAKNNK